MRRKVRPPQVLRTREQTEMSRVRSGPGSLAISSWLRFTLNNQLFRSVSQLWSVVPPRAPRHLYCSHLQRSDSPTFARVEGSHPQQEGEEEEEDTEEGEGEGGGDGGGSEDHLIV